MAKNNKSHQFSSYKKKKKFDKLNNPQRADWSGLLKELRGESSKNKQQTTEDDNNTKETKKP